MPTSIRRSWFLQEMAKTTSLMVQKGWGERQNGSVSIRLLFEDIEQYEDSLIAGERQSIGDRIPGVGGQYYLVMAWRDALRDLTLNPEESLTILRVSPDGDWFKPLWGNPEIGISTWEIAAQLRTQDLRQQVTLGRNRVMMQCSPPNLTALASLPAISPAMITRALWEMNSQCLQVCPDGVGVMHSANPGTAAVGISAAESMRRHRMTLWPSYGIFAGGANLQEAFELIDTLETAAALVLGAISDGGPKQFVQNHAMRALAEDLPVKPFSQAMELEAWFTPRGETGNG